MTRPPKIEGDPMEKHETPQARFDRLNSKVYRLKVMTRTEADIITKLDSVPNKAGYIKQLIRADVVNGGQTQSGSCTAETAREMVEVQVLLPEELVRAAGEQGIDLSQLLQEILKEHIGAV